MVSKGRKYSVTAADFVIHPFPQKKQHLLSYQKKEQVLCLKCCYSTSMDQQSVVFVPLNQKTNSS